MLEHLFDAELVCRSEMEPLAMDGEGELIGSGDGSVAGPAIAGRLAWTLFERPGKLVCAMKPGRGDRDRFGCPRSRRGTRVCAPRGRGEPNLLVAATLRLEREDERYCWLDNALGVWEGEFDAEAHRARYGPSFRGCCDVLNFFETRENLDRYLEQDPSVSGHAISFAEAIEAGRIVFGDVFAGGH